jgi:glycosyltransferase involved in cell wall biosynthesis
MEDRVRVCFYAFLFSPSVGGAQVRAEKQARQLQMLGHNVIVVTVRHHKQWARTESLDGLRVVRVGGIYRRGGRLRVGRLGQLPVFVATVLALWRLRHAYDVIHAMQLSPAAALAGRLLHKPVILSVQSVGPDETQRRRLEHGAWLMADTLTDTSFLTVDPMEVARGGDLDHFQHVVLGNLMLHFVRHSDACYQVLSSRGRSYLISHGFPAGQIVYIRGSVDTAKFRPSPVRRPDPARPERDIICLARLYYAKGVDVLLHAWSRMMREPVEWRASLKPRLLVAGEGVYLAQMERIVAELGIGDSVAFLGLRTDVIDLLQQCWGLVMPSRWEGMPNALLEGMACGLPCVATRVSGSEDAIIDGVNGLLVEPEQPAEMAQALRRIIEDADLAQRLGREARASVVRDYQLGTVVEQYLDLYRRRLVGGENVLPLALERGGN